MASIIIAETHELFREALCGYLRYADPSLSVTGVQDFARLTEKIQEISPDIVLVDTSISGWDVKSLRSGFLSLQTRVGLIPPLSYSGESDFEMDSVSGVFPRSLSCREFMRGITSLLNGEPFFPVSAVGAVYKSEIKNMDDAGLTPREKEVVAYLLQGKSNKDIARALGLQVVTVKLHVRGICRKMGVVNRVQAALKAKENGWG